MWSLQVKGPQTKNLTNYMASMLSAALNLPETPTHNSIGYKSRGASFGVLLPGSGSGGQGLLRWSSAWGEVASFEEVRNSLALME